MKVRNTINMLLATVFFTGSLAAMETTTRRIDRFADDLTAAWTKYPTDKQKFTRDEYVRDTSTVFTRDIVTLLGPENQTIDGALNDYIARLKNLPQILRIEKAKAERTLYLTGCTATFNREVVMARDFKDERTTQRCFDWLIESLILIRNSFAATSDQRNVAINSINTTFNQLLQQSKASESTDPMGQFDQNVLAIRQDFLTSTPELQKRNQPFVQILETAAKVVKQKSIQK
jgi:hypothetical protein